MVHFGQPKSLFAVKRQALKKKIMYLYQSQSIQCTKSSQLKLQIYLADTTTINI